MKNDTYTTMKTRVKSWVLGLFFVATAGGALMNVAVPQTAAAACTTSFFGIPAWYKGMVDDQCNIKDPAAFGGLSNYIWRIALNIVEILLITAGYVAVAYIIYGGFKFITSAGAPDDSAKARKTIINAVVGLIISIFSVAIVNVVTTALAGGVDANGIPTIAADNATLVNILNVVYTWAGIIAVLMIVIGGLLYVISGGNQSNITKAKDTIIYSVVGLIIVLVAFTITQFVLGRF